MTEDKFKGHTLGKWVTPGYCDSDTQIDICSELLEDSIGQKSANWICSVDGDGTGEITERMEADARLIMAAPDLLAENERLKAIIRQQTEVLKDCKDDIGEKEAVIFLPRHKEAFKRFIEEIKAAIKLGDEI